MKTGLALFARKGTTHVNFGFVLPLTDPNRIIELAPEVEAAGWDGIFVAEMLYGPDAWVVLTGAAMRTERVKLGTMLSPVARMRPWKIASETATLDRISNGRVILAVGLGAPDTGYAEYGEIIDRKTRIELTEETLEIALKLWSGERFTFQGKHYQIDTTTIKDGMSDWEPKAVQTPHIPIWLTGAWPVDASMRRAIKHDGLLPNVFDADRKFRELTVEDVAGMRAFVERERPAGPFDIIVEGESDAGSAESLEKTRAWERAGATWWIESRWSQQDKIEELRARIAAGPPR